MMHISDIHTYLPRRLKQLGVTSFGALSILGAVALPHPKPPNGPTGLVREGPFAETLSEPGTIGSSRLLLYGSTIPGVQVKIAEIVPESQVVRPGDVLVRFDSTTFEQNLTREEAAGRQ